MIPTLEYQWVGGTLKYRYSDIVDGFDMPVRIISDGSTQWIFPTADWKETEFGQPPAEFSVDPNFYVESRRL